MTALTHEKLLDIDPNPYATEDVVTARVIALRHAWNWAVEAEEEAREDVGDPYTKACMSQAWSAIAEALK